MADFEFVHRYIESVEPSSLLTLLLLHGTGANENDLNPLGNAAAPGVRLLALRGKVSEDGMLRFFRRLAPGVFDEDDVRIRAGELAEFVAWAATYYGFDPDYLVALGFSNGANMAAATLLLHPSALAGAALLRAQPPLKWPDLPDLKGKPIYISAGRRDTIVPVAETQRLIEQFKFTGADVQVDWRDGGHAYSAAEIEPLSQWIADPARPWNRSQE